MNENHFPIVSGPWDNGGGLFLCINSCMFARMYVCLCRACFKAMMHSPCFRFPYFRKIFRLRGNCFTILPLPKNVLNFHPPKFMMTFYQAAMLNPPLKSRSMQEFSRFSRTLAGLVG